MNEYPYYVDIVSGESTVRVEVSRPTRTVRMSLKKAFARMQADIGEACREIPDAVEAYKHCDGDISQIDKAFAEMAKTDLMLPARLAPLFVAIEEAQDKYTVHGFQAIVSLKPMTAADMKLVMSQYNSEFWSGVEDLSPLVKAIDFFRSQSERGSEAGNATDAGVANIPEATGAGEETPEAAEVF